MREAAIQRLHLPQRQPAQNGLLSASRPGEKTVADRNLHYRLDLLRLTAIIPGLTQPMPVRAARPKMMSRLHSPFPFETWIGGARVSKEGAVTRSR